MKWFRLQPLLVRSSEINWILRVFLFKLLQFSFLFIWFTDFCFTVTVFYCFFYRFKGLHEAESAGDAGFFRKISVHVRPNVFEWTRNTTFGLIWSSRTLNIPYIPFSMKCFYSTSSRSQKNSTFLQNNCWFISQICNYSNNLPIFLGKNSVIWC